MQSILLPGRNPDTVQPGSSLAKAFDIKNAIGVDLEVSGMVIKYKDGLERVTLDVKNRKAGASLNIAPTGEGILLSAVGTPMNSKFMQVLKLRNFPLRNNTAIDFALGTPGGETVNPSDVDVTLICDTVKSGKQERTALIPWRNDKQVDPDKSVRFELKNPIGKEMSIVGIICKFRENLEQILATIETKNGGAGFDLTPSGVGVALSALGSPFNADLLQMFRLKPVRLTASGVVGIKLASDPVLAETVFVNDVDLTFVCEYKDG